LKVDKVKVKCTLVQALRLCTGRTAHRGSRGIALPRTQHDCHHDTQVKPEAVTAVIELLMMGGEKPETC